MSPRPSQPGRNDPCPCGSGKKYKACHAGEDRERERAAAAPSSPGPRSAQQAVGAELDAAVKLLGDADTSRLSAALERLGGLLERFGPAPGLRFAEEAFGQHVSAHLKGLAKAEEAGAPEAEAAPADARRHLLVSTVRALATPAFLEQLRVALLGRAQDPARTAEERQALYVGALLAAAGKGALGKGAKGGRARFAPEDVPVLDVLFDVQLREWTARQEGLAEKLAEQLAAQAREDPELGARLEAEAKERAARVEAALRRPETPALFTPEEELWFTCVLWGPLGAVKSASQDPEQRRAAVTALIRAVRTALTPEAAPGLLEGLLARLRERARDPQLPPEQRDLLTDAAIAFEAEPARMVMASLFTGRQESLGRSAEEAVLLADLRAKTQWTPADLEPLRAHLEAAGLGAAAERVRQSQAWLAAHPVSLG
ncbi:zinc chelation protein SecC [Aggregicoccus sp. 17bor-14]|uniref:SEC-C domain-containing protein n=1 Tax=Myxococcaceae TaxID=31 RepID=UPI00129C309E|nr:MULTISPECIES: SEC-C domain-containing protein [Myxococcaceae]MRI91657.1 zinc chelation protein SecC [Aggregicoccus sp. 17bor-14]